MGIVLLGQAIQQSKGRSRWKEMDPGTHVEVREGRLLTATSNSRQNQIYVQTIDPGWNIGVDKLGSRPLSDLVNLHGSTGTSKIPGLTDYHVVRPQVSEFPADCDKGEK